MHAKSIIMKLHASYVSALDIGCIASLHNQGIEFSAQDISCLPCNWYNNWGDSNE